jgi:hypothetical protein
VSYITLRDRFCDIIVLNVGASREDKISMMDSFCDELERVMDNSHMKILLGHFNAKIGKKDILRKIGDENLHEISNDTRDRFLMW